MAPPKKNKKDLCASALYFRNNPKARKKKDENSKRINKRGSQKAKRRDLGRKNYAADKKGVNRRGKDLSHTSNGLRYKSVKANRGSKSDTNGDRNARGGRKKGKR